MAKNLLDVDVAMRRLSYLVKRRGNIDDKDAYNSIVRFLKGVQEEQVNKYPLLSRMFCALFLGCAYREIEDAQREGRAPSPNNTMGMMWKLIDKPFEWLIDDMIDIVRTMRLDVLYKDYEEGIRNALRVAEKNKVPAEESPRLKDDYQWKDVVNVVEAKNKSDKDFLSDLCTELIKEYSREDVEYFIRSQITKLSILCR